METTLRVYDRHGARLGVLPWSALSRTIVRNTPGALTATVPRSLVAPGLLDDGLRFLRVAENGVEAEDWYVLDDDGEDDADAGGDARLVSIGGTGAGQILEWANVYSWEYVPLGSPPPPDPVRAAAIKTAEEKVNDFARLYADRSKYAQKLRGESAPAAQVTAADLEARDARNQWLVARHDLDVLLADVPPAGSVLNLEPTHGFADATPGHILKTFIDAAKARGCFPYLTYSFTSTEDSSGTPWPYSYARNYELGTSLLKVVTQMVEDGWVDWEMRGFQLDLYVADTALALDHADTVLRLGKHVRAAPRKRSRKGARSVILANGAEGAAVELSDPESIVKYGRREGYEGRNGITDVGTLTAATQVSLTRARSASESITLEITPNAGVPDLPRPGGYIRYDKRRLGAQQLEPMRVQSIAWDYGDDPKLSVELNDLWVDRDIKRGRQIDAILNGSSANERVPQQDAGDDKVPPGPVLGLAAVSSAYLDATGREFAQVTATWAEVTIDADGTAIDDLLGYDIEWRQPVDPAGLVDGWTGANSFRTGVVTMHQWSPVVANSTISIRIRAVDRYNNGGVWSAWDTFPTGRDESPPPRPTTPQAGNYLGLFRAYWDGKFIGDTARVADFSHVEVHIDELSGFTPDDTTLAGTLATEGALFREKPYGVQQYVKLVGVDFSGNRSEPTGEATGTPGQVLGPDIFERAVGEQHIAYAAIKTAHIDDLAVNDAKIGNVEVGKLVAGTMTAEVIMGGRISTADPGPSGTAARVELNSLGIFRWNGVDADPVVAIDDNGALLTGIYRTATSGRRIEIGAAGYAGELRFVTPGGLVSAVRSFTPVTGDVGVEAIDIGLEIPGTFRGWNHLQLSADEESYLVAKQVELVFGGTPESDGWFYVSFATDKGTTAPGMGGHYTRHWRYAVSKSAHWWRNTPGTGMIELTTGDVDNSPKFRFHNGRGAASIIKFYQALGQAGRFEFRGAVDDVFIPIQASNVALSSDERGKTGIDTANRSELLTMVRGTPVARYRRKVDTTSLPEGQRRAAAQPVEIGLIAQQAPKQIVAPPASDGTLGIDLYQMAAATWGATGELADLVEQQARELAELRKQVATLSRDKGK